MVQDRVYIEVTKGDLDLLMESVLRSCYSWRLAHAAMDRGEQVGVGVVVGLSPTVEVGSFRV